ncbi:MAG: FAD-binding protein [Lachnospiraceae bacterium]
MKGETLEELAEQMDVPAENLIAAVDDFNAHVAAKEEDEFGRTLYSTPIDNGPFYAAPRVPTVHHTMGGVKINTKTEVIDTEGNVIPGLYAAGEVTGGIHGANRLGGNALTDTVVFGRIAGQEVAAAGSAGTEPIELTDGSYYYEDVEFNKAGYKNTISMEVKDGEITSLVWDCLDKDGVKKSQLSMEGKYVMSETGMKWHEQAEAVAQYVVEHQSTDGLTDANGYTDVVASVSVNLEAFVNGVEDCMKQAAK